MIATALAQQTAVMEPRGQTDRPLTIAVTSGKGGVGKSQLVLSLAVAMQRAGKRVLLVDADVGCGNLDVLLDLAPAHDLRSVLSGDMAAADVIATAHIGGVYLPLLPAPVATRSGADLDAGEQLAMVEAVGAAGRGYDVVLVDTGAGVSRNPMLFGAAADRVLVVTTPEPTAIRDAYAAIKVLHQAHAVPRVEVVVNQAASSRDGKLVYSRLAAVVSRFMPVELGYLGQLPEDDRVARAVRARRPVSIEYPTCAYVRAVELMLPRVTAPVASRSDGGVRFFARTGVTP